MLSKICAAFSRTLRFCFSFLLRFFTIFESALIGLNLVINTTQTAIALSRVFAKYQIQTYSNANARPIHSSYIYPIVDVLIDAIRSKIQESSIFIVVSVLLISAIRCL